MANEKNLKPIRSKKVARELGAKGGKAKAENLRRRKSLRENMEMLLGLPIKDPDDFNIASIMGVDMNDMDNAMLLTVGLFRKAKAGDVAAYKEIRELVGESGKTAPVGVEDDPITKSLKEAQKDGVL